MVHRSRWAQQSLGVCSCGVSFLIDASSSSLMARQPRMLHEAVVKMGRQ